MIEIWHNPRCSKSRQAMAILDAKGVAYKVRQYLKEPPTETELRATLTALGKPASQVVRRSEAGFVDGDEDTLIAQMVANPILIERPIVIVGREAVIGRPPEEVLSLLD